MHPHLQGEFSGGMWTVWGVLEVKVSKGTVEVQEFRLREPGFWEEGFGTGDLDPGCVWVFGMWGKGCCQQVM